MIGLAAGFVSGLLGIGGGLIMVPLMVGWLGMPLKVALGTSLLTIVALVIPGTVVHVMLGHIDWAICLVLTLGAVPGARIGASLALDTKERTLRLMVGSFLLIVAVALRRHRTRRAAPRLNLGRYDGPAGMSIHRALRALLASSFVMGACMLPWSGPGAGPGTRRSRSR